MNNHLIYEHHMMLATDDMLRGITNPGRSKQLLLPGQEGFMFEPVQVYKNALHNSYYTHAYNIIKFLCLDKDRYYEDIVTRIDAQILSLNKRLNNNQGSPLLSPNEVLTEQLDEAFTRYKENNE